jgi:hypothetical protein
MSMEGITEEIRGVGRILDGGVEIGQVVYSIRVHKAGMKGFQYPFAKFEKRGFLEFYDYLNKPITLVLEDGRKWDCILSKLDGTVLARGEWPEL